MTTLGQEIELKFHQALKKKDTQATSILRLVKTALVNERIAKMHDLTEEEEVSVLRREVKKREEAAEIYDNGGAASRAQSEREEVQFLKQFLPPDMADEEIKKLVQKAIDSTSAKTPADFGKVMGVLMREIGGKVSGEKVSKLVKEELQKN